MACAFIYTIHTFYIYIIILKIYFEIEREINIHKKIIS